VLDGIISVGQRAPVVFPVHPRTRKQLAGTELGQRLDAAEGVILAEPLGYLDFVGLLDGARLVLTDSGGIQEETTVLGVPCLTLRPSTERPVTVTEGTNTVVGTDVPRMLQAAAAILDGERKESRRPRLWDGHAGERIVAVLAEELGAGGVLAQARAG
jgi:UDP-N-acetylglucosamine 2-epimerase (non-hydrolysing)